MSLNPIDEESFERVILAADLTRGSLRPATQAGLDRLLRDLAVGYLDFDLIARPARRDVNGRMG